MTQNKKIIRNFDYVEITYVRENSNNIWFSAHLFVTLHTKNI